MRILLIALLLLPYLTHAQDAAQVTTNEIKAAEERFTSIQFKKQLVEDNKFPDGATGVTTVTLPRRIAVVPDSRFATTKENVAHKDICRAETVVLARAGKTSTALTSKKQAVISKTTFTAVDLIKPNPSLPVSSQFSVVRLGGDYVDNGKLLRYENLSNLQYVEGRDYLLVLGHHKGTQTASYFLEGEDVPIINGQLIPKGGTWLTFSTGESYADAKAELVRIAQLAPCQN